MMFLWEMPAIFFIAGASIQYAKVKSFKETVVNRVYRVMVPYWIYLIVTLLLYSLIGIWGGQLYVFSLADWSIKDYLMAFGGIHVKGVVDFGHLWFIVPYMAVSCIFPLVRKAVDGYTWKVPLVTSILLFILQEFVQNYSGQGALGWIFLVVREIFCYLTFYMIGYLYYKKLSTCKCLFIGAFSLVLYLIMIGGELPNMQEHKFPPDVLFLIYGIFTLSLWGVILSKIIIPRIVFLRIWNKRGFTIYLYQDWIMLFIVMGTKMCIPYFNNGVTWFFIIMGSIIFALVLNTFLSRYTYEFEQRIIGYIRR